MEQIHRCLQEWSVRLITLTGPAGVGKTRLVIALAASLVNAFADGVFFVNLSAVEDPRRVPPSIALFVERAQGVDPDFRLDEQNARTVATSWRFCRPRLAV